MALWSRGYIIFFVIIYIIIVIYHTGYLDATFYIGWGISYIGGLSPD